MPHMPPRLPRLHVRVLSCIIVAMVSANAAFCQLTPLPGRLVQPRARTTIGFSQWNVSFGFLPGPKAALFNMSFSTTNSSYMPPSALVFAVPANGDASGQVLDLYFAIVDAAGTVCVADGWTADGGATIAIGFRTNRTWGTYSGTSMAVVPVASSANWTAALSLRISPVANPSNFAFVVMGLELFTANPQCGYWSWVTLLKLNNASVVVPMWNTSSAVGGLDLTSAAMNSSSSACVNGVPNTEAPFACAQCFIPYINRGGNTACAFTTSSVPPPSQGNSSSSWAPTSTTTSAAPSGELVDIVTLNVTDGTDGFANSRFVADLAVAANVDVSRIVLMSTQYSLPTLDPKQPVIVQFYFTNTTSPYAYVLIKNLNVTLQRLRLSYTIVTVVSIQRVYVSAFGPTPSPSPSPSPANGQSLTDGQVAVIVVVIVVVAAAAGFAVLCFVRRARGAGRYGGNRDMGFQMEGPAAPRR